VKAPLLEFSLEVPEEPFWDEASLQPPQHHFVNQSGADRHDDSPDQDLDAGPSISSLEAPRLPPHPIDRFEQRIAQYSANPGPLPEIDPSENVRRQNEEIIARIERLWAGRSDPFARYPIKMNLRAHELIDHS